MIDKTKRFFVKNFKWIILFILSLVLVKIIESLFSNNLMDFDNMVYNYISKFKNTHLTLFFKVITEFGDFFVIALVSLLIILITKNKKYIEYILINLGSIILLNQLLKHIFLRDRPINDRLIEVSGYSFPSGHSMVSAVFYGFIICLIWRNIKNKALKISLSLLLCILIILIGISRIYLGVHYASDVIAGFCISIIYIILFTSFIFTNSKKNYKN